MFNEAPAVSKLAEISIAPDSLESFVSFLKAHPRIPIFFDLIVV